VNRKTVIAGLGTLILMSACGTTVKTTGGSTRSGSGDSGLNLPAAGGSNVAGSAGTAAPSSAGGAASGGSAGSSSPFNLSSGGTTGGGGGTSAAGGGGSTSSPGGGVTSKLVPAHAPGITKTTIYLGLAYSSQSAAGDKAIGAAGAAPSYDTRNVFNSVVNYANAHGGFAGRKLQALYYDVNLTTDSNTQDQSACAFWTQDNKSFAVEGGDNILDACGQNAGALSLGAGSATEATFKQYPNLVDPDATALDRLGSVTAAGLYKAGYFSGKVGLVTWDDPNYRATITNGYLPVLSSHHITPAQITYVAIPQQIGALGDMSAAVSSAVAKFKALGIDHVIVQDGPAGVWAGDGLTFEWMNQAKSQDYYPRYGENTLNSPGTTINPSDEQNKSLAISDGDIDSSNDQGWHPNASRQHCFQIEAQAGYPVSPSNENDEGLASAACDFVFFLQKVMNELPDLTVANFISATESLGTSFAPATVYGSKFSSGVRDGGDQFRTEEYLQSCSCLQYQGAPYYPDGS
jgi:hypothetical protein